MSLSAYSKELKYEQIQGLGNKLGYGVLSAFVFIVSFNTKFPLIVTIGVGVLLLIGFWKNFWKNFWKRIFAEKFILLTLALFAYYLFQLLYTHNIQEALFFIQLKSFLPFFAFTLVQFDLTERQIQKLFDTYAYGVLTVVSLCLAIATVRYVQSGGDTSFFGMDHLCSFLSIQSSNFSTYILIALFIFFHQHFHTHKADPKHLFFLFAITILSFSILLLGSKLIIVIFFIYLLYAFFRIIQKHSPYTPKTSFFVIGLSVLSLIILYNSVAIQNRFRGINYITFHYEDKRPELHHEEVYDSTRWTTISYRVALLRSGWRVIEQNPLWGVSIGDRKAALIKEYHKEHFLLAIANQSLSHNTFMNLWIATGLVGLFLFIVIVFYLPLQKAIREKNTLQIEIIILLILISLVDNYFDRLQSVLLMSLFVVLGLYRTKTKSASE